MDFSRIARQLDEMNPALSVSAASTEKAATGGQKQVDGTTRSREKQKAQMSQQQSTPKKSDISYTSEEYRKQREYDKMIANAKVDWREDLIEEAERDHPYVDVMPFLNQKQMEAKRQEKGVAKMEAGKQAKMANEEMTLDKYQKMFPTKPKKFDPDARKKQRGRELKAMAKNAPKDTRTDAQKMTDATGPRPGSRYRGD